MSEKAIEIDHLSYGYSSKNKVLKNINLTVPKGSIYGFIGPNGSGKSTTMGLLTDLIPNDVTSVFLFDNQTKEYLPIGFKEIGSLIESPSLYLHMTGEQNLKYICTIRQISTSQIDGILDKVGLFHAKKKKVKKYSLGMKQRLAIAITLLHNPQLLLLDEPVNGLDPNGMIEIRELLMKLNKEEGVTIFISSHLLDEIEKMCTHIGVINKGEILFEGTKAQLNEKLQSNEIIVQTNDAEQYREIIEPIGFPLTQILENEIKFKISSDEDIPKIVQKLTELQVPIYGIQKTKNLENQFLELTQNTQNVE